MLIIRNLTKQYDQTLAVNNVSFTVKNGEATVLLGPNGAGKSTTIKCIAGLLNYEGEIDICGYTNKSMQAKKLMGYVPETPALYDMLTVKEHLEFIAHAYSLRNFQFKMDALIERFDLADKRDKLGKELSKGMQQKVSICCALLIEPEVIFFDEPLIGLDPKAIKELKKVITELKDKGCSILFSTHIIDSIDELWDNALIMGSGRVLVAKSREEFEAAGERLEDVFFQVTEAI
jgi:ABC-2 type transport system ATP-binding protein